MLLPGYEQRERIIGDGVTTLVQDILRKISDSNSNFQTYYYESLNILLPLLVFFLVESRLLTFCAFNDVGRMEMLKFQATVTSHATERFSRRQALVEMVTLPTVRTPG